jgi:hypothetical protein
MIRYYMAHHYVIASENRGELLQCKISRADPFMSVPTNYKITKDLGERREKSIAGGKAKYLTLFSDTLCQASHLVRTSCLVHSSASEKKRFWVSCYNVHSILRSHDHPQHRSGAQFAPPLWGFPVEIAKSFPETKELTDFWVLSRAQIKNLNLYFRYDVAISCWKFCILLCCLTTSFRITNRNTPRQ